MDVVSAGLTGMDLTVSIGNHDAFPKCQWDFIGEGPSFPGREELREWVPESQYTIWDRHGYYTKDLTDLKTRVISLNTQSCDWHN